MHEFSLATQIVESVKEFTESRPGNQEVLKVRLLVGELAGIEAEQLRFCYNSITRETPLERSRLEVISVPALVRCSRCLYRGVPRYLKDSRAWTKVPTLQCPKCGTPAEATQGYECELKSVQFAEVSAPKLCHLPTGNHRGTSLNAP
ncbi:MAG TPA: hydrogenase maturation nickel metallochaperone HypA [Verrucomicrobiae bacterium]|nr:hydrogenase maturation nickel metallochaperone HypA [Verrucomicrobiae bacterium]